MLRPTMSFSVGSKASVEMFGISSPPVMSASRVTPIVTARILHLLVALRTSARREIEQGPEWFDRPEVARILTGLGRLVNQFAGPMQSDDTLGPASEHRHDRHRLAIRTVAAVVMAECVVRRRDQPRMLPALVARKGGDPYDGGSCHDNEIAAQALEMRQSPLPHVDERGARRARTLGEWHVCHRSGGGPGPLIHGVSREHVVVHHQRVAAAKQL